MQDCNKCPTGVFEYNVLTRLITDIAIPRYYCFLAMDVAISVQELIKAINLKAFDYGETEIWVSSPQ